jgi:hypothetical protein
MAESQQTDKAEESADITKTREYLRFKRLLRQAIKAPPMPRRLPLKQTVKPAS